MSALRTPPASIRFNGPKLSTAVPIRSPFHRDALIEMSLDPAVRSIGFVGNSNFRGENIALDVTTVNVDGRHYYLDIVDDCETLDIRSEGLALLALHDLGFTPLEKTAANILRDPVHSNCAKIWQHSRDRVATEDQFDVLHVLQNDGPQRLGRLADAAYVSQRAILAMACSDLIEIDIHSGPLGAHSMIRRSDRIRLSPPQVIAV